jgi:hypothetical protein
MRSARLQLTCTSNGLLCDLRVLCVIYLSNWLRAAALLCQTVRGYHRGHQKIGVQSRSHQVFPIVSLVLSCAGKRKRDTRSCATGSDAASP